MFYLTLGNSSLLRRKDEQFEQRITKYINHNFYFILFTAQYTFLLYFKHCLIQNPKQSCYKALKLETLFVQVK